MPTWENLPTSHVEHAVLSLIVLFHLGGLGKGSRRGLGSLDIRRWNNVDPSYIDPSNISSTLRRLSVTASNIVSRYPAGGSRGELPAIPAIAEDVFRLFRCKIENPVRAAVEFSRAVLRPQLSIRHGAWILGLPRRGYKAGVSRRASPIMFSAHRGVGFISAFYSSDWPNRIRHGRHIISVTDEEIERHMNAALDHILSRLNQYGIKCREVKVW
ncbi:MAG: hypothetical protein LRS47_03400 [Desulfurococcales archaeon]|nr:hypothetical protein [Desulfurococcales archaeon]